MQNLISHSPMPRTRVKFCGLTRLEDIACAVELSVDYLGLVFAPHSPRRLTLDAARRLRRSIPAHVGVVALMMNQPAADVQAVVDAIQPDILQFHGGEDNAFCAQFGLPFWKAIAMGGDPARGLADTAHFPAASAFLFDGHAAGEPGGSGQRFDWSLLPAHLGSQHLILAGGLTASNITHALRTAAPWGVDLSSGIEIESAPGIKDAAKMRAFIQALRQMETKTPLR